MIIRFSFKDKCIKSRDDCTKHESEVEIYEPFMELFLFATSMIYTFDKQLSGHLTCNNLWDCAGGPLQMIEVERYKYVDIDTDSDKQVIQT